MAPTLRTTAKDTASIIREEWRIYDATRARAGVLDASIGKHTVPLVRIRGWRNVDRIGQPTTLVRMAP